MKVTVVGTGYVGLVTGVCLANSGHDVVCIDIDPAKVALLSGGTCPIYEPGVEDVLRSGIDSGRLRFSDGADGWAPLLGDVVFIAVGTPMSENGSADLSQVRSAVARIVDEADHDLVLVMKSTVPPGTGRLLKHRFLEDSGTHVRYVSNPEFLREGSALQDWYETDRILLGSDDEAALEMMKQLYADIDAPVLTMDIASAETSKYASNAFLSTKISFVNEIANMCDCVDADIDAVATAMGMDKRIGPHFLKAGIGYGGSCFPKDTRALDFLATLNGYHFHLLRAVIELNNRQRLLPVIRLERELGDLFGRKIAVLGLAFKPFTDDVRESPTLDIVPLLAEKGADVDVYDPLAASAELHGARRVDSPWEALEGASAVILVTEWPEFVELDWARAAAIMKEPRLVIDGRNALDGDAVRAAGLSYMAIGRDGVHRAGQL
jgi:UDPglucose 6-dehydrogenase